MVAGRVGEDVRPVLDAAALGIASAEIEPAQPRQRNGRRAHRAGLQGDVDVSLAEPLGADDLAGMADRQHLRMSGGIGKAARLVAGRRQHRAVCCHDHRADRHFAARGRALRLDKGDHHVALAGARWHKGAPQNRTRL